jgi:ABC-2 type transport system permease protein
VIRRARKYLAVARQLVRIGVIRKSQFRVEFFCQVAMDILWYASHALVFEILFLHTQTIAGWSVDEVRVFLGFLFVADAFLMAWLGQAWHFSRELKDGVLDPFRVRPISPVFLYFFQRFSLEGTVNMAIAFGYLFYALGQAPEGITLGVLGWTAWGVAIAWWSRTVLTVFFATWEFYVLNSDLSHFCYDVSSAGADRPLDIFDRRTRFFLLSIVPVGALAYIPASMVLGRFGPLEALGHTAWLFALGLLVFRGWRRGFRRYESAMS